VHAQSYGDSTAVVTVQTAELPLIVRGCRFGGRTCQSTVRRATRSRPRHRACRPFTSHCLAPTKADHKRLLALQASAMSCKMYRGYRCDGLGGPSGDPRADGWVQSRRQVGPCAQTALPPNPGGRAPSPRQANPSGDPPACARGGRWVHARRHPGPPHPPPAVVRPSTRGPRAEAAEPPHQGRRAP
jgi:hypothetical protein